jgi:N-formylglutamate deformylase
MEPFYIIEPSAPKVPIIISVPHCGVEFPAEVRSNYVPDKMALPDDTDWFVHDLYRFASAMGITIIHAKYSRWVIDLNRDPASAPLYDDGRIITGLTSTTDFFGNSIYKSEKHQPDAEEVERRLTKYYWPYYVKVQELLNARKKEFGKALLWDAHSIRQHVPTIREDFFPDMILGNNDRKSAGSDLIDIALNELRSGAYQINHNDPFKGGHITRYFGKPDQNIHGLQLEMNKILYMNDEELEYDKSRVSRVVKVLKPTFQKLIEALL